MKKNIYVEKSQELIKNARRTKEAENLLKKVHRNRGAMNL